MLFSPHRVYQLSAISSSALLLLLLVVPVRLGAQTVPSAQVSEGGYTLFFLGLGLVALAVYNLRKRKSRE